MDIDVHGLYNGVAKAMQPKSVRGSEKFSLEPDNGSKASGPASDSVELRQQDELFRSLSEALQNTGDTSSERVASLKLAINSGHYTVDSQRLAARLLAFDNQLAG